jgi:hypothetical protein
MKKEMRNRDALRALAILCGMGLMGLSYPYGSSSWFRSNKCFSLADNLETSFFRCPPWYADSVASLGMKPYCVLEMDGAVSGHPERSMVDLFVPSVQQIIDRAGMSQSDTTRAKHYRLALFQYFWYTRWPTKTDSIWQDWMGDYYGTLSNFGGTLPDYVELTNCLNCCHRSNVLRWLAFGFGCDSMWIKDTSPGDTIARKYLYKEVHFGQEPNDTTVVVKILEDSVIYSINPDWQGGITEDTAPTYLDTLCVCELYYYPYQPPQQKDTIYFTINYNLKKQIIGLQVGGLDSSDVGFWTPKWYAKHVLEPVYDTLHDINPNVKVMGPSIALAARRNFQNISLKYLLLSEICLNNLPMPEKTK